jgi:putative transposase
MARRLRIQFPGARYHVINRGNLQHDIFATPGAVRSFLDTLEAAAVQFRWRVHAFVVMRNHYHLALETPAPNLVEGMHWLQSTFAIRLTRFHRQHGHIFQGRYKALLVQDGFQLGRVCDYIHLNPVRARVVPPSRLAEFKPSSLWQWLNGTAPGWLEAADLLRERGLEAAVNPWLGYADHLIRIATAGTDDERCTPAAFSSGWAIGTEGWRKALARERAHLALAPEMAAGEVAELKIARWQQALETALERTGKTLHDIQCAPKSAGWKIALARHLRATVAPSYRWLADALNMGKPSSLRVYLSQAT